jgi:hypothetical protein
MQRVGLLMDKVKVRMNIGQFSGGYDYLEGMGITLNTGFSVLHC